ncbi:DUF3540 domain-containing protein [Aquabacterium sp. A7-Y]|uniref:DUF3540 domain-containing protein n=1 Tax=Aquabacterium sp. A7-Y TaxID=1349605 RepID=UPI00223C93D4|nr:DUF3540 domain-containing protein [Aquabacterium sp. A7-Y]MCW7541344.1 DUF3540 domain-containing protein [Aquabacterium sp. A7-Y]
MNEPQQVPTKRRDGPPATMPPESQGRAPSGLTQGVIQQVGEVERVSESEPAQCRVTVSTPAGLRQAGLATSCLTVPAPGDVVLLAGWDEQLYVLAVLARGSAEPLVLRTERDTTWVVQGGLAVQASGAVDLASAGQLRLGADRLRLEAEQVDLLTGRLGIVSRVAQWVAEVLETTATSLRQVSRTHTLQAQGYHRQVDELESARVGHVDLRAREMLNIQAQHTVIKSRELVKIDGKQIQVG